MNMNMRTTLMLALSVILLASCRQGAAPAAPDMAALRAELQQHTQQLMMVHFKLDNALQAVSAAEVAAGDGDCSGAGYHATDAYRELQAADDELLAAGLRLQQRFNLDAAGASGN
jgi:hypothetical protein